MNKSVYHIKRRSKYSFEVIYDELGSPPMLLADCTAEHIAKILVEALQARHMVDPPTPDPVLSVTVG